MAFIDVKIEGITPLICHKFSDAAAEAASNSMRSSSGATDRGTPLEQAQSKLYLGLDGNPMIPQPNLLRCLVDGGKYTKIGKSQVTTQKSSLLYAALDIVGVEIPIHHVQPWKVDTRAVRIPSTGGRILAHRPMFDDWALVFQMELDVEILSIAILRRIVDDAGKRIGLGDFRPATKGPYGRFNVTHWAEKKVPKTTPKAPPISALAAE